jgi:glucokinase
MDFPHEPILLGDIGATNARLALLSDGVLGPINWFRVSEFPKFSDAVQAFLRVHCRKVSVRNALLAVAGPVEDNRCVLTNCPWTIDAPELGEVFGFAKVDILNDFEVAALSLPHLSTADLCPVGGGQAIAGAPMAVLGPGTGLGVACLVPGAPNSVVIASEGGHVTMATTCRREDDVIGYLRQQFTHVSAERVCSGVGLENLYRAVVALDQIEAPPRNAAEITQSALDGNCPAAKMAIDMFCAMLGTIAGNVALMFGARGGVYIAGGIAPRFAEFMAHSEFRKRFENKGRFRPYLEAIPASIIVHPAATFIGLQSMVRGQLELEPTI